MSDSLLHEKSLVEFLSPKSQGRFLKILEKKNHETLVRELLDHNIEINLNNSEALIGIQSTQKKIVESLNFIKAPKEGYIYSSDGQYYGIKLATDEAIYSHSGRGFGFFLSLIPGKLAYYEQESPGFRCIVKSNNNKIYDNLYY